MRLWRADGATGDATCVAECVGFADRVAAVAVQPTGAIVAGAGRDASIRLFAAGPEGADADQPPPRGGKRARGGAAAGATVPQRSALGQLHGSGAAVLTLSWTSESRLFSAGEDHCVREWDVGAGKAVRALAGARVINGVAARCAQPGIHGCRCH